MSTKIFTEAEMEELRASPYVQKVSSNQVFFSAVFKEELWKRINEGIHARDAIRELGIDPEIIGDFLEQQLEYKDQEIEFLKKIVSLGKGEAT